MTSLIHKYRNLALNHHYSLALFAKSIRQVAGLMGEIHRLNKSEDSINYLAQQQNELCRLVLTA